MGEFADPGMGQCRGGKKKKKEQALFLRTTNGEQSHPGVRGLFRSQCLIYYLGSLGVHLRIWSLEALRVGGQYCGVP